MASDDQVLLRRKGKVWESFVEKIKGEHRLSQLFFLGLSMEVVAVIGETDGWGLV
ncbi:hypothetical protein HanPSC8_Chr10g0416381 [Helianthus annuus]|nr:hypothetical protein HanPSC8_Chr10g0416381 [Helianthus annuus]